MSSTFYIVSTPIGNLEDITLRALRILKEVDLIACEDTRHSLHLLQHFQISKPLMSCYQQNQAGRIPQFLSMLEEGKSIALITDAGTPGISDPGQLVIQEIIKAGFDVVPIPGACAAITALSGSGLPTNNFYFHGFLPLKPGKRRKLFESLKVLESTLVFYEAGNRMHRCLRDLSDSFTPETQVVVGRELTKKFEEFLRGTLSEVSEKIPREGLRGECVVLVSCQVNEEEEN